MRLNLIIVILLHSCLLAAPVMGGDLEAITRALENMADASRSADEANDAIRDLMRDRGAYHYRDYHDRYYRHYHDDDDYLYSRKARRERAKALRKAEKEWRKKYEHEMKRRYHHRKHDDD